MYKGSDGKNGKLSFFCDIIKVLLLSHNAICDFPRRHGSKKVVKVFFRLSVEILSAFHQTDRHSFYLHTRCSHFMLFSLKWHLEIAINHGETFFHSSDTFYLSSILIRSCALKWKSRILVRESICTKLTTSISTRNFFLLFFCAWKLEIFFFRNFHHFILWWVRKYFHQSHSSSMKEIITTHSLLSGILLAKMKKFLSKDLIPKIDRHSKQTVQSIYIHST